MTTTISLSSSDPALGQSEAFLQLQEAISRAAKTERPVILIGERGTGKELAASRLHLLSPRWGQPYITLNCGGLAPTLLESELFGHEAGAFTGATQRRKGRFELADGGTLFLDEVANLPTPAQEKLLRVIEYGRYERVGGMQTIDTDVRLIAATNVDLRELAAAGRFRQDLLDRLSFEVITLPPLRARREDIWLLTQHFARRMAQELGLAAPPPFAPAARKALEKHDWPGNIRELKNTVERMVYRCAEGVIDEIVFDPFESSWQPPAKATVNPREPQSLSRNPEPPPPLTEAVRQLELARLREALAETHYHQRHAAERLGLTYHQFRALYRKYQVDLG